MIFNRTLQAFQWLCFSLSFLIPAFLATNYVLNNFYVTGANGYDIGWFAYLSAHTTHWPPSNPAIFSGTFFSTHISLIFYLYSAVYHFLSWIGLSFPPPILFGVTQGAWFGLLSLSAYSLLLPTQEKRNFFHISLAFVFALLALFNGVSIAILLYPHFEIAIPALLVAFFALWTRRFNKLCYIPLIIGLMVREDAGLHYAWIFALLAITFYFFSKKTPTLKSTSRYFFCLMLICLAYAIGVIALQKIFFPSDMLEKIYLGSPPLHHITWSFIKQRFFLMMLARAYIYIPLFLCAYFAYSHRDWLQALGLFVVIPWVIFSFFAITISAGILTTYYAFPILIALLWPAITYGLAQKLELAIRPFISYWKDVSIILGSSLLSGIAIITLGYFLFSPTLPTHYFQEKVNNIIDFRWAHHWKNNQRTLDTVFSTHALGENFMVDSAVAVLEIDNIATKNYFIKDNLPALPAESEIKTIDVMLYLPNSTNDSALTEKIIAMANLTVSCPLPGSSYQVAKKPNTHPEFCNH